MEENPLPPQVPADSPVPSPAADPQLAPEAPAPQQKKSPNFIKIAFIFILLSPLIYIGVKIVGYLPPGTTTNTGMRAVDYARLGTSAAAVPDPSSVHTHALVLNREAKSDRVWSILNSLPIFQPDYFRLAPKFKQQVSGSQFELVYCDIKSAPDLILVNSIEDEVTPIDTFPYEFSFQVYLSGALRKIPVVVNSLGEDGTLDVTYGDASFKIPPNQELYTTTVHKAVVGMESQTFYLRNLPDTVITCLPDSGIRDF